MTVQLSVNGDSDSSDSGKERSVPVSELLVAAAPS